MRNFFLAMLLAAVGASGGCCCLERCLCQGWRQSDFCCNDCGMDDCDCGGGDHGGDCGCGQSHGHGMADAGYQGEGGYIEEGRRPHKLHASGGHPLVHRHRNAGHQYEFAAGPPTGAVTYPYYTNRGPRDFLAKNPRSTGP